MIIEDIPTGAWSPNTDTVFQVDVVDATGAALDCSAFALEFIVRSASNGAQVMKKTGASIATAVPPGGSVASRVSVTTGPSDNALVPGTFRGALWRTDVLATQPLWQGNMPLAPVPAV